MIRVELPWACFGLVCSKGRVVRAAPIAAFCIGWPWRKAWDYWLGRGAAVERIP